MYKLKKENGGIKLIIGIVLILLIILGILTYFGLSYLKGEPIKFGFNNNSIEESSESGILLPSKYLNIKFKNLDNNSKIYILISEDLLNYNLEKEIAYEKENASTEERVTNDSIGKIEEFYNNHDYLGYVNYSISQNTANNLEDNDSILLRSYYFLLNGSQVVDEYRYNNKKYVRILIPLKEDEFSVKMQDFLYDYDVLDTKVMIEDSSGNLEVAGFDNLEYVESASGSNQIKKCNVIVNCEK